MDKYILEIGKINNTNDMKALVRKIFKDLNIDDIDFNDLIYDYVIPKLKQLGVNMDYDWENDETNYERVMKENYE